METTATPNQEELLKIKDAADKAATKVLHKPFQSHWRDFLRNLERNNKRLTAGLLKFGKGIATKSESVNQWYLAHCFHTIYGGAFAGSIVTCASVIFGFITAGVAVASMIQLVGAALFILPIIVFCIYWAIRILVETILMAIKGVKATIDIVKAARTFKKENPNTDLLKTVEDNLKAKLTPAPTDADAY